MIRDDIILEDTTLRDGEQSPGVAFSKETKLKIHDLLVEAGVRWIEAGIPVMGGEELETMKALLERGGPATLVAWNRGVRDDLKLSLDIGFKAVHIGLPTSELHLKASVNKDRTWLLGQAADLIKYAKDRGAFVSISAEDVARTEISFLQEYAGRVEAAGADRLRVSDTIGILTPEGYGERIRCITESSKIDLQCHAHNDFGLATANTLAGLQNGARYFHVTVNGIGERAGMADLAQVVIALKLLYSRDVGVEGTKLKALSNLVAEATRCAPPPWQPVVGNNVFAHESGIHVNGMLRNERSFEPILPEEVGGERRYVLGKHSGRVNIRQALVAEGIEPAEEDVQRCLDIVRDQAIAQAGPVRPEQLRGIYQRVLTENVHAAR
jgi:homocitrate synthase NifV